MPLQITHGWDVSPQEAVAIQQELRVQVIRQDCFGRLGRIAGVDAGFEANGAITQAAVAVLSFPELSLQETALVRRPTTFPYLPGLLSFREAPAILEALSRLGAPPDLLVCDGHGLAHPRRLGLACHLGLACDTPSIGVAKSPLVGHHQPVGEGRGDWQPLWDEGEVIGAALRTQPGVRPVYVSIGHRLSLGTAIDIVLRCTTSYRLPEPIRQAHRMASGK
jgi:deoxyribonuclease V